MFPRLRICLCIIKKYDIIYLLCCDYLDKCVAGCSVDNNRCDKYWMLRKEKIYCGASHVIISVINGILTECARNY